jgi:hypothetical protein
MKGLSRLMFNNIILFLETELSSEMQLALKVFLGIIVLSILLTIIRGL